MNNKIYNDERFYQQKFYIKIKGLYKTEKYNSVIKQATNYLEMFPNDVNVRFMRAKSYRKLNLFEEAINDLKYNLDFDYNAHSITELYFIYYYLNRYEEAIQLLPLLYEKRTINAHSVSISELVMKKQLGIDVKMRKDVKCNYVKSQIFNYSTIAAINHITERHLTPTDENTSNFKEGIDLNYLFNLVRSNIKDSNKSNSDQILEVYYFGISNIGYKNNETCNFIQVVVVPNTNNIISMYPTNEVDPTCISNIEIDYDKLFNKKEEKVKKLSQIDKFNNRYKRV